MLDSPEIYRELSKLQNLIQISGVLICAIAASGCEKREDVVIVETPKSKWAHVHNKDPIDDTESVSAVLRSDSTSDGRGIPAELHLRCSSGTLEVYISWNRYIGTKHLLDTRVDSDPHEPNKWWASSDGKSSFYPFVAPGYLKRLRSSSMYAARVEISGGNPVTAIFDTSELEVEVGPLIDSCKA